MIVNVPIQYQAEVKKPRHPNFKTETFSAEIPLNVAEISERDAPLVAVYEESLDHHARHHVGMRRVELRSWDGMMMRKVAGRNVDNEIVSHSVDAEWLLASVGDTTRDTRSPFRECAPYRGRTPPRMEEVKIKAVARNGMDDAVRKASEIAARLAFLDGELWERAEEPVLVLEENRGRKGGGILMLGYVMVPWMLDQCFPRPEPGSIYRLDEAPVVEAIYGDTLKEFGWRNDMPAIVVHDPSMFTYDATDRALEHAARLLLKTMGDDLKEAEADYLRAYAELKGVVVALSNKEDLVIDDDFVSTLHRAAEQVGIDHEHVPVAHSKAMQAIRRRELTLEGHEQVASFSP